MSAVLYDLLTDIAGRCNIKNENVLKKSKELIAILNSKQKLNCSDTCKAVVCLEIASSLTSHFLSREEAIKYSGCKKKNYANIYNNISKLLNLDKIYSVREICLLIGASDIQEPVMKLLLKYKHICDEAEHDFEHPMYPCAAILAFSRVNKIKTNLQKLVEISRVKKQELDELTKKFQPLMEVKKDRKNSEQKKNKSIKSDTVIKVEENEVTPRKRKITTGLISVQEYIEWKRKMLQE